MYTDNKEKEIVSYSDYGIDKLYSGRCSIEKRERKGVLIGYTRKERCLVKWDGLRKVQTIHRSFLKTIQQEKQTPPK